MGDEMSPDQRPRVTRPRLAVLDVADACDHVDVDEIAGARRDCRER